MKLHSKIFLSYIGILSAIILSLSYFFLFIQKEQTGEKTNVFGLLLPESECILCVNQNEYLCRLLKNDTAVPILSEVIPAGAVALIKEIPSDVPFILTFQGEEILIYTHVDQIKTIQFNRSLFASLSPYPPQEEIINGKLKAYFYALPEKKFFGYFTHNGILVAGFSRKLLEKAALRQILLDQGMTNISSRWYTASKRLNLKVPLNLMCSTEPLRLSLCVDSIERPLSNFTLTADVYYEKESLYCFGSLPLIQMEDSLYHQLAEKISIQTENLYPRLAVRTFLEIEDEQLFYSVCGTSSISTTNPSNE